MIITSSDEGFKVPPLIIEKWMKAKMFWLAFSTMLFTVVSANRLTTSLAVSSLMKALKLTVSWSYTCCGRGDSGEAYFKSAAWCSISFMISRRWSEHHSWLLPITFVAMTPLIFSMISI